jgi:hypothetical protein
VLLVTSCAGRTNGPQVAAGLQTALAGPGIVVGESDPAATAIATSKTAFDHAPAVLLARADDVGAQALAASVAVRLALPLLLTPATADAATPTHWTALAAELQRLRPATVVHVGAAASDVAQRVGHKVQVVEASPAAAGALAGGTPQVVPVTVGGVVDKLAALDPGGALQVLAVDASVTGTPTAPRLPSGRPARAPAGLVALVDRDDPGAIASTATLRAARIPVVASDEADPRTDTARALIAQLRPTHLVTVTAPGRVDAAGAMGLVASALAGTELPGGGQVLFPGRRLVALYGTPGSKKLGALGEQDPAASVARVQTIANSYRAATSDTVVPAFEIITTVADSTAGDDGNYSRELSISELQPWIDAASQAGMYVVLDLQPGYSDFPSQAKEYEALLSLPNVGLALDPEWRLAPGQKHLKDIGSVDASEVNETAQWLAGVVRAKKLPQKLFVLHQFKVGMVKQRDQVSVPPELALVVQMDGNGTQSQKLNTWQQITADPPPRANFGWKNFFHEDKTLRSPSDTLAVHPSPVFVSYQ